MIFLNTFFLVITLKSVHQFELRFLSIFVGLRVFFNVSRFFFRLRSFNIPI